MISSMQQQQHMEKTRSTIVKKIIIKQIFKKHRESRGVFGGQKGKGYTKNFKNYYVLTIKCSVLFNDR